MKPDTPMTIAKARFFVRVQLERLEREAGAATVKDFTIAIQTLIDDAVERATKDLARK
jgi:hypothetical protein